MSQNQEIDVTYLMMPRFNPRYDNSKLPPLSDTGMLPPRLIQAILEVYENETEETLLNHPHNLIATSDGKLWTTWNLVLFLKGHIRRKKTPILYLPNGTALYEKSPNPPRASQPPTPPDQLSQPPHQPAE